MKSLSLSALTLSSLLLTMMLLNSKCCGASISLPEMEGDVPLYFIADSNLDLEFMMDSEINRILGDGSRAAGTTGVLQNGCLGFLGYTTNLADEQGLLATFHACADFLAKSGAQAV
ncbi:hypothetical protein POTOM_053939 [Populus tomentosa]|uniref:Uncharacterized protein n=1 Tax=Populus tomentosa TaxID=118781 RepID=A0A8X7Y3V2_POPTO|nr:hypothetical protein POTOM_053939 [Populus tomentosa]